jgi:superfamily I DNA/RNA helicase
MNVTLQDETIKARLCESLNPEQQEAVMAPLDAAVHVMAGAGTGKTELITRRFAKLTLDLQQDQVFDPTEKLWVATFTDKAAQEMKLRIGDYLAESAGISLSQKAWIGTFHSLCNRMLNQNRDNLTDPKGVSLLSNTELELLQEQMVKKLLFQDFKTEEQISLDNLLALGLGDPQSLFEEIVFKTIPRIKSTGLSPEEFNQLAHRQAEDYASLLMGFPTTDPLTGHLYTSHEQYAHAWEKHLLPLSTPRFSFYPREWELEIHAEQALGKGKEPLSREALLKEALKPLYKTGCFVSYNGRIKKDPFGPAALDFESLRKAHLVEKNLIQLVSFVYQFYQNTLKDEQACDYDDLIREAILLLENHPNILNAYREQFAHWMIDEFQDSNGSQLRLMQLLVGQTHPKITVVGDKKQSIYGFRFAEPENLHLLFDGVPNSQTIALQTNYRSVKPILDIANQITRMMEASPQEQLHPALNADNKTNSESVTWFTIETAENVAEAKALEVQWITESVSNLLRQENTPPEDIAILVRDHTKALQIEEALEELGIPAIKQRNLGFFQSPVIQQAVALLELAEDPNNDFALLNLLQRKLNHRELYLLAKQRAEYQANQDIKDFSYYKTLTILSEQPDSEIPDLTHLMPLIRFMVEALKTIMHQKDQLTPDMFFAWLMTHFPLISPDETQTAKGRKALKQLLLLKIIFTYWCERSRKPMKLKDVLLLLKRAQAKDDLELPVEANQFYENAVRILTIHGAKGMQFPIVFLAGVERYRKARSAGLLTIDLQHAEKMGFGLFLNRHQEEKTLKKLIYDTVWHLPRNQAEELRLFYVGVTRAKKRLFLSSWPQSFPYMNPQFFQNCAFTTICPDTST